MLASQTHDHISSFEMHHQSTIFQPASIADISQPEADWRVQYSRQHQNIRTDCLIAASPQSKIMILMPLTTHFLFYFHIKINL